MGMNSFLKKKIGKNKLNSYPENTVELAYVLQKFYIAYFVCLENFYLCGSNVSNPDLEKYRHQAEGINSDPFLPYN